MPFNLLGFIFTLTPGLMLFKSPTDSFYFERHEIISKIHAGQRMLNLMAAVGEERGESGRRERGGWLEKKHFS